MTVQECVAQVRRAAAELKEIDLGFPLGHNGVLPAAPLPVVDDVLRELGLDDLTSLREFYRACNGLNLPDVHVGYFIKPIAKLVDYRPESEPTTITGSFAAEVVAIGSTGGGGLFVVEKGHNTVLYLPPGPIHSGIYDGTAAKVVRLSQDFGQFLHLLVDDIVAFVRGEEGHHFVAS